MDSDLETTVRGMYGPDVTFLGVRRAELDSLDGLDVVFVGAPFDSGASHRPGARFGPQAIRATDYLPHDGSRPHLALGVDPLAELHVADVGDVLVPPADAGIAAAAGERRAGSGLRRRDTGDPGGDHTITLPDATGVARHTGWGRDRSSISTRTPIPAIPSSGRCTGTARRCGG